jgi:hypothetical protein
MIVSTMKDLPGFQVTEVSGRQNETPRVSCTPS